MESLNFLGYSILEIRMPYFDQFFIGFHKVVRLFLTILLFVLLILLTYQVVSRHFPILPQILWSEELARFLFIWLILIGSAQAVVADGHFVIDVFENSKNQLWLKMKALFVQVLLLILSIFFLIYGYEYMEFGLIQKSDFMQINMGLFVYSSVVLFAVVWILHSFHSIWNLVFQKSSNPSDAIIQS